MSIYLYKFNKDIKSNNFFDGLKKSFDYLDYENTLIDDSNHTLLKDKNIDDVIFIGDCRSKYIKQYLNNEDCIYILKNIPDNFVTDIDYYELLDYKHSLIKSFTKLNDHIYFRTNNGIKQLMCLWGSYLLPNDMERINQEIIEGKGLGDKHMFITKPDRESSLFQSLKHLRFSMCHRPISGVIFDFNDDINCIDYISNGLLCYSSSTYLTELFNEDLTIKDTYKKLDTEKRRYLIVRILNKIYKNYMMYQRCKELINLFT